MNYEHTIILTAVLHILLLHAFASGVGEDYSLLLPDSHIYYIYILFLNVLTSGV